LSVVAGSIIAMYQMVEAVTFLQLPCLEAIYLVSGLVSADDRVSWMDHKAPRVSSLYWARPPEISSPFMNPFATVYSPLWSTRVYPTAGTVKSKQGWLGSGSIF